MRRSAALQSLKRSQATSAGLIPRRNGLNVVRLALALMVVVGHAWLLDGYSGGPTLGHYGFGPFAVAGFFTISGYLITKSRMRTPTGRYLWHRALRIFPGLWVVLLVTGFVLAPLSVLIDDGGVSSYSWSSGLLYVPRNAFLLFRTPGIYGTLGGGATTIWNGSIWTLLYEFACYIAVAVLASVGLLRRRWPVVAIVASIVTLLLVHHLPGGNHGVGAFNVGLALGFFVPFGAGMIMALYERHIELRWSAALACAALVGVALAVASDPLPLMALPLAYLLLWIGATVPAGPLRRVDLSYGVYIYGYPVQQLLARTNFSRHGPIFYLAATLPVVLGFAWGSWHLVEKRSLRLKEWAPQMPT